MTTLSATGLRGAEEARGLPMLANGGAKPDSVLAEELGYVHSTGGKGSKQSYLAKIAGGTLRCEKVDFASLEFRLVGSVGFVSGAMTASVLCGGEHLVVVKTITWLRGSMTPAAGSCFTCTLRRCPWRPEKKRLKTIRRQREG